MAKKEEMKAKIEEASLELAKNFRFEWDCYSGRGQEEKIKEKYPNLYRNRKAIRKRVKEILDQPTSHIEEKMKTCYRCKKGINKESYISFIEYEYYEKIPGEIEIKRDYVHKDCWNEVKESLKATDKASEIIRVKMEKAIEEIKKLCSEDK